jgi:septum site-determining protein MinC
VTLLRGRRSGLEVALAGRDLDQALEELRGRLDERPEFYRGSSAVATFGTSLPSSAYVAQLRDVLRRSGVELRAIGGSRELETLAAEHGLGFEAAAVVKLSHSAQSLVADFAGARSDIAARRRRGEASVRKPPVAAPGEAREPLRAVEAPPGTLYHAGTLRGGQALHHPGNIVLVGDLNPGAELIAAGDVLVFGRLAGVAHAGAQGEAQARVYAIDLSPTQLRIATSIAVDVRASSGPHVALVRDGRIVVLPLASMDMLEQSPPSLRGGETQQGPPPSLRGGEKQGVS